MNYFLILTFLIVFLGAGCSASSTVSPSTVVNDNFTSEKFSLTTDPQDAVFRIAIGRTGGLGSMPILDAAASRAKTLQGSLIYFDESYRDKVRAKLPSCIVGEPEIIVSANVTLIRRSEVNTSVEDALEETYYEAVVNRLNDIQVRVEACE